MHIDWYCADPAAYDLTETEVNGDIGFPYTFPIDWLSYTNSKSGDVNNDGTADTWPTITLIANNACAGDITITNTDTGETLTYAGTMADTEVVVINCRYCTLTKEGAADMINTSGEFPKLQPGHNLITFTGFTGQINISYYQRYL